MEKKNHIKVRFSTIVVLCIPAILLCTAPCGWADGSYLYDGDIDISYLDDGEICDITEDLYWLNLGADTTVNLYADVSQYVLVHSGGVLNIYSGSVVGFVIVSDDEPYAVVTVYGTGFAVNGQPVSHGQVAINGELTGTYGGGENGGDISLTFLSGVPINLKPLDAEVEIDIKPGGNPNNINLRSKGVVPVVVFTIAGGLDAGTIDPDTVLFAGAGPVRSTLEDLDEDGDMDMLFHFKTQGLVELDKDSIKATLTGTTFDGEDIELTDTVRIVQSKKE